MDTNAVTAAADREPAALAVISTLNTMEIPGMILGEHRIGIEQSRGPMEYAPWLVEMIAASPMLSVDEQTTHHYADISVQRKRSGRPIPTNDMWIAALCRQHGSPVVSRGRHFDFVEDLKRVAW